jgi:hypothetical protein
VKDRGHFTTEYTGSGKPIIEDIPKLTPEQFRRFEAHLNVFREFSEIEFRIRTPEGCEVVSQARRDFSKMLDEKGLRAHRFRK